MKTLVLALACLAILPLTSCDERDDVLAARREKLEESRAKAEKQREIEKTKDAIEKLDETIVMGRELIDRVESPSQRAETTIILEDAIKSKDILETRLVKLTASLDSR